MASTNFMFKGKQGSIDSHGFISWGGMGFNFESAGEEMKTAISKATGIKSETVPANKAFSNGRQKAQQEIANRFPLLNVMRTMSKSQVKQKCQEGAEVSQGDLATVKNGSHIQLRLSSGKIVDVKIEGE